MTASDRRAVDWILARTPSCFAGVVRARRAAGDRPDDPAKVFHLGRHPFGLIEFSGGRWLVLAIDHALAPAPMTGVRR